MSSWTPPSISEKELRAALNGFYKFALNAQQLDIVHYLEANFDELVETFSGE